MTEVITARMIIPVAIPMILLLIDGLSIRLDSWKIKLCAGSRADVSAVWSAINAVANSALSGSRIYQLAISHQRCRAQALIEDRELDETPMQIPALASPAANPPALRRINAIAAAETTCLIFEPWQVRHIHVARQLSATSHELFWSVE